MSTEPQSSAAPIIAIASGKGGVGKTWLAITLAHAFAKANQRVLLFDGDLGLANVDIQLGLYPERDLMAVLGGRATLADVVLPSAAGGFDIVAGRSGSGALASMPPARIESLRRELAALAGGYDRVVIDLGAGVDATVRGLAQLAGTCLVVTTDEPTALTDAYAFIKLTVAEQQPADLRVVVNLAGSRREGENTHAILLKACRQFLKIAPPLAGIIRRDPRVRDAIRHQTPFLTRYPTAEAASDVVALAGRLSRRP